MRVSEFSSWESYRNGNFAPNSSYAEKELTNSQEKELTNSLYWLIKTSRQVVIVICRQRTNKLIRLSS